MKIYVVRHASTEYNEKHLINGQHDDKLSSKGLKELPELVENLKSYNFTTIYSSPLKRALETAEAVSSATDIDIIQDNRLMEVNFGSFTSKNWASMEDIFGMTSRELLDTYSYDLRPYGGESALQVKARLEDFLSHLFKNADQTPLIVTHGGVIRWLYLLLSGEKTSFKPNASIHEFKVNLDPI
jgi:broad specificity phosphatase PhoE